jgi:hypothetical protein
MSKILSTLGLTLLLLLSMAALPVMAQDNQGTVIYDTETVSAAQTQENIELIEKTRWFFS